MSEKRILIPWDELPKCEKENGWTVDAYEEMTRNCTTPLRTSDDIMYDGDVAEIKDAVIAWWKVDCTGIDVVIDAVLKIATRPPSDPVAEMDSLIGRMVEGKFDWCEDDVADAWQKVKELLP